MPLSQPERSRSGWPALVMPGMRAGDHQVPNARTALGHAYGGGSQYFSMWAAAAAPG